MVEGTPPASPPESEGTPPPEAQATPPEEPAEEPIPRTPEEIEAFWKNRISGKDRAHAAETATLREQLAEKERLLAAAQQQRSREDEAQMTEAEQWKAKAEEADRRAEAAERQRVLDVRGTKYAAAAEHLDEGTLASMDEAKLAALNARLTGDEAPESTVLDPSAARRPPPTPPGSREKSAEELEADLKSMEPEFVSTLNE